MSNALSHPEQTSSCRNLGATLADLIDVMDIAMWELDHDFRVISHNRKAREIYGDRLVGHCCYQVAAGRDSVCPDCPALLVFAGQASGRSERQRTTASGRAVHIDHIATPIHSADGRVTGALVLIIDITRHKEQERELIAHRNDFEQMVIERTRDLAESQARYRRLYEESKRDQALWLSLLNAAADALVIHDLDGRVQYLNPSFSRTFGWTLDELQGRPLPFADNDEAGGELRRLIASGQPVGNLAARRPTRDGRMLDVSISAARYTGQHGESAGLICSFRDVTEARAMERQLQRIQRFEAMATLAGGIAHDFNNLLMGIEGSASLLLMDLPEGAAAAEKLRNIEKYVRQGEQLTRQLLGLARRETRDGIRVADLNGLIAASSALFGQTRREITLRCQPQPCLWPVEVDPGQIEQVLLNLFVNAAHAMPLGGEIRLATANVHLDRQEAAACGRPAGRYVRITVADSGCGIDPQILDRIFDPFFTTREHEGGTGLGLASAYGIVSNHGGIIQAGNGPLGGAEFTILLPASERAPLPAQDLSAEVWPGCETILLVDDEPLVLRLTRDLLQRLGYTVLPAATGTEALDLCREHPDRIDLAIVDMVMPGMSGPELFQGLRAMDGSIRGLLSTGYDLADQAEHLLDQGFHGFIQKPFTLHTISCKLREILDKTVEPSLFRCQNP